MVYDVISPTVIILPIVGFILLGIAILIFIGLIIWLILKNKKK